MINLLLDIFIFLIKVNTIDVLSYTTYPEKIRVYWKNDKGYPIGSLNKIKGVAFAMNAGMFMPNYSPVGLYIENGKILKSLNQGSSGNWQYETGGVFGITKDGRPFIYPAKKTTRNFNIQYATQSGPILIKDGQIQPLNKSSKYIRNGVGILPDDRVLLAVTKEEVTLHEFAQYFKDQGCINALYLDGAVSEAYYPEKGLTECYGNFGPMIGVIK